MSIRPTMRKGPLLRFLLLSFCCLLLAFAGRSAFAAASDCVEDDPVNGRYFCSAPVPEPWSVWPCDDDAGWVANYSAWCRAGDGTYFGPNASPDCAGATPSFEDDVAGRSVKYMNLLTNSQSCSIATDTGWNASTPNTNFCWGGTGEVYKSGFLISDHRHIIVSCGEGGYALGSNDIRWYKGRNLTCPLGTGERSVMRNGVSVAACTVPVCLTCDSIGNPVTAASGYKVESQNDYRGAGGLVFTRYYHSFRFMEPMTFTADGHTPTQAGPAWRSNFDKRVLTLAAPGILALGFPDGQVQYFNSQGKEIFNYSGGRASLVTLPAGGGYVYQGPDVVETYYGDGRLQSITQRSGETLILAYGNGLDMYVDRNGDPKFEQFRKTAVLLRSVTNSYGHSLSFKYNYRENLAVMTDPSGARTLYRYDPANNENLASVTYPDGRSRSYGYAAAANIPSPSSWFSGVLPRALTSIVDENGNLYGSYTYDAAGRVTSSQHALGAMRYQFDRPSEATTNITDPLGTTRSFSFAVVDGITRFTGNSSPGGSGFGSGVKGRTYDLSNSNLLSQTDFNNNKTCYTYDTDRNLETARVEGLAAATDCPSVTASGAALPAGSRKIVTEWHARWRLPVRTSEPRRRTTYVYNGDSGALCAPASAVIADGSANGQPIGVLCSKAVQSTTDASGAQGFNATLQGQPRSSYFTYNSRGRVLTADGPRTDLSDIATTTYYAEDDPDAGKRGQVATITNAAGHLTSITAYNVHGQPLTIVDPNGQATTLAYDDRQRLVSRNVGGEVTSYEYDDVGQMTRAILPDSSSLSYAYDAAHRLTGMSDNLGNRTAYTLDAMGNRTKEEVFDPANVLAQTRSRVYDNLNRLAQEVGAQNQTTAYAYDNQGNLVSVDGPLAGAVDVTTNAYDALNRLVRVTDPNNGQTQYAYNGIDQLTGVTDPRNLSTTYNYDGLANLNSQQSPDTGTTANTYDAAGNLLTRADAKGQVTTYTYDALNRISLIGVADGPVQAYTFDTGANGIGRITLITELNSSQQITSTLAYAYDSHGRTISETRTINGVAYVTGYSYDGAGRLSGLTYPSGRTVAYSFDALGRISQVGTTPPPANGGPVVSNIAYFPFGGVKSYTLGNGQTYTRSYDLDGRIASYTLGAQTFALGYDAASRISFITDTVNAANTNTYSYDNLDRLVGAVSPNVPFAYIYDNVGNRTSKTVGAATDSYAYDTASNRLASITAQTGATRSFSLDNNGSTTNDGVNQYVYDTRGRMVQSVGALGTTTYQVNALGQRIRKTNPLEDRIYLYDARGRLIAETDPGGTLRREYIYLNDIPLAVIQ